MRFSRIASNPNMNLFTQALPCVHTGKRMLEGILWFTITKIPQNLERMPI